MKCKRVATNAGIVCGGNLVLSKREMPVKLWAQKMEFIGHTDAKGNMLPVAEIKMSEESRSVRVYTICESCGKETVVQFFPSYVSRWEPL